MVTREDRLQFSSLSGDGAVEKELVQHSEEFQNRQPFLVVELASEEILMLRNAGETNRLRWNEISEYSSRTASVFDVRHLEV